MNSRRNILIIIFSIVVVSIIFFALRGKGEEFKNITNYPLDTETPVVVAFGDSLTAGTGSTKGNDYVSVLSKKINLPIINKGREGDTSNDALRRVGEVEKEKPDVVLVFLGGNDVLQKVSIDITFINLEKIISRLQKNGALIVLIGIRGGVFNDPYKDRFVDLASRYHVLYIPDKLLSIMAKNNYMADSVHPNDKGYEYLASHIHQSIKGLFSSESKL